MSETLLQFGGGNFLRAFVDLFLHEANVVDDRCGRAVVVTSTDSPRSRWINEQDGRYHVAIRGLQDGERVDDTVEVITLILTEGESVLVESVGPPRSLRNARYIRL